VAPEATEVAAMVDLQVVLMVILEQMVAEAEAEAQVVMPMVVQAAMVLLSCVF
jgi:hypothetical protein